MLVAYGTSALSTTPWNKRITNLFEKLQIMLRLIENTVHSRREALKAQAFFLRNNTILAVPSKYDHYTNVTPQCASFTHRI
jgi:hypothetical protein